MIGIADLGRIYTAMSQVEAGAREAADYGAFQESNWIAANYAAVEAEMTRRACTAALGLPDYVGAADGTSCTNPTVSLPIIEGQDQNAACPTVPPIQQGLDPPCIIRVELTYTFHSVLNFPLVPGSLTFSRDSRFAVSALPVPGASTPPSPSPSP